MPRVHECAGYGAGAGVKIFVGAPDGEIDIPMVQGQRHVARRVSEIDPDGAAALLRNRRDARNVEELPGKEIHSGEKDERDLLAVFFEDRLDVFLAQGKRARTRSHEDEAFAGVEAVMRDL